MVAFVYHSSIVNDGEILHLKEDVVDQIPFFKILTNQAQLTVDKIDESFVLPPNITPELFRPIYTYVQQDQWAQLAMRLKRSASFYDLIKLMDFLGLELPAAEVANLGYVCRELRTFYGGSTCGCERRMVKRRAAVLFLFGLANNMYHLDFHRTKQRAKSAIKYIFSHPQAFTTRIRKHSFEVYKTELLLQNHVSDIESLMVNYQLEENPVNKPCSGCVEFDSDVSQGSSDDEAHVICRNNVDNVAICVSVTSDTQRLRTAEEDEIS